WYPEEPPSVEAMLWLMQFWTSAEMNWQRLRTMRAHQSHGNFDAGVVQANFEKALQGISERAGQSGGDVERAPLDSGFNSEVTPFNPSVNAGGRQVSQQELLLHRWQELSATVAKALQQSHPHLFESPRMQ